MRFEDDTPMSVVNVEIRRLIPSAFASLVVSSACCFVRVTFAARAPSGARPARQDRSCTFRRGQARATPRPNDTNVVPPDGEGRVHGLAGRRGDEAADSGPDCIGGQNEAVAALGRLEAHQAGERPRPDLSDVLAAEADRDRGRHELLGVGCRSPGFCGRDCGRLRLERDADRPGAGECGAAKLSYQTRLVDHGTDPAGENDGREIPHRDPRRDGAGGHLAHRSARAWRPFGRTRKTGSTSRSTANGSTMDARLERRSLAPRSRPQLPWPRHRGRRAGLGRVVNSCLPTTTVTGRSRFAARVASIFARASARERPPRSTPATLTPGRTALRSIIARASTKAPKSAARVASASAKAVQRLPQSRAARSRPASSSTMSAIVPP